MNRFEGRTAVVTGASRGLGRAVAIAFAQEGAFVYCGYQKADDEAAKTVAQCGGKATALKFDVSKPEQVQAAFDRIHAERQRVDVLVNNAACNRDAPAVLLDPPDWREVIATGLDGAFFCSRAVLPAMMHAKKGAIVNVASATAVRANPGQANYAAAKGGLLSLTRTLAAELAPKGIRVNAVVPGLIDAGMVQRMDHRALDAFKAKIPFKRLGTAEEFAKVVLFLASDDAAYVTGAELPVDGGLAL